MNKWSKIQQVWRRYGLKAIKLLLLLTILAALTRLLKQKTNWHDTQLLLLQAQNSQHLHWWVGLISFVGLNWSLEAYKWQLLVQKSSPISFFDAFKGVLAGVSLGSFSPLLIGDFVGRITPLSHKREGATLLLYGHYAQGVALLLFGAFSYYHLCGYAFPFFQYSIAFFFMFVMLTALFLLLFSKKITLWLNIKKIQFTKNFIVITKFQFNDTIQLLSIALLRHLVFALQFYFAFNIVGITLPFILAFSLTNIVFLFKTVGSFVGFWGDIATRQLSAIYLFGLFSVNATAVLGATLLVWFINLFLPICIGLIFVAQLPIERLFHKST